MARAAPSVGNVLPCGLTSDLRGHTGQRITDSFQEWNERQNFFPVALRGQLREHLSFSFRGHILSHQMCGYMLQQQQETYVRLILFISVVFIVVVVVIIISVYLCARECVLLCMPKHPCGDQRKTFRTRFFFQVWF